MTKTSQQMDPKRLAELRARVARGAGGYLACAVLSELLDDRDWHRARVHVTLEDVRSSGVTWEQMLAYAAKHERVFSTTCLDLPDWYELDLVEGGEKMLRWMQSLIYLAAVSSGEAQLDVLAEISQTRPRTGDRC